MAAVGLARAPSMALSLCAPSTEGCRCSPLSHVMLQALPSGVTAEDLHVTVTTVCTLNIVLVRSMKTGLWFIPRLGRQLSGSPVWDPLGKGAGATEGASCCRQCHDGLGLAMHGSRRSLALVRVR